MKEVTIIENIQTTQIVQVDDEFNLDHVMTDEYKRNQGQYIKSRSAYDDVLITDVKIFEHELKQDAE